MAARSVSVILAAVDRMTAPLRRISQSFAPIEAAVKRVKQAFAGVDTTRIVGQLHKVRDAASAAGQRLAQMGNRLGALTAAGGAIGTAGVLALGNAVIKTTAQFERFEVSLETIMGDKGKAKEALNWISDFAAKTPYELAEVTEAFVKLKSYGIDPYADSLKNAGNVAAIMPGKTLNQAVEAMADAMVGENERLKEFGITAKKEGDKIQYNWIENGQEMTAFAESNSKKQMLAVINGIWNRQYAGGMDKLSATWDGMVSNMKDAWSRFTVMIGQAGLFDFLKSKLQALLDKANELAANGTLKRWAQQISDAVTRMLSKLIEFVQSTDWDAVGAKFMRILSVMDTLANLVGGPLNAGLIGIAGIVFGPLLVSLTTLAVTIMPLLVRLMPLVVTGVKALGAAMVANPIGAVVVGLVALSAAAFYVGKNWEWFRDKWLKLWEQVKQSFSNAWGRIKQAYADSWRDLVSATTGFAKLLFDGWLAGWMLIINKTKEVFNGLVEWLNKFDAVQVGKDLVQRLWDGMKEKWDDLKKWFKGGVKGLFNLWGTGSEDGPATTGSIGGAAGASSGGGVGSGRASLASYARSSSGSTGGYTGGGGTAGDATNPGGAQPSEERGRGSANLMNGQYGGVGENQTQITTKSGKNVTVHKAAAASFKGFLDELEGMGYKINSIGGLAIRSKRGGSSWSQHAYGNAIDINPTKNPMYRPKPGEPLRTDLPPNISDVAAKHGLSWGGDWKSVKDTMHFEWTGKSAAEKALAADLKAKDEASVAAQAAKHPFAKMGAYVQSQQNSMGTLDLRGKPGLTPGLQNNNYGNLKYNPKTISRYTGVEGPSTNTDEGKPQFVFKSIDDGIKSTFTLIQRKYQVEGRDTVRKMIEAEGGWTPGKRHATNSISKLMGIGPDDKMDLSNPDVQKRFMKALGTQEHGMAASSLGKRVDSVIDAVNAPPKKIEAPLPGSDTFKKAGEQSLTRSATTTFSPTQNFYGTSDKDLPKKVAEVNKEGHRAMVQRQREALHD